jgi:hypothetical protein
MTAGKLLEKSLAGLVVAILLANVAGAAIVTGYASGNIYSNADPYDSPVSITLDITPFDTTLGTLNSVTMYAEVNVSGSTQIWSINQPTTTLTYDYSNTLFVAEMGSTVASAAGSEVCDNPYWDEYAEMFAIFPVSGNNYTVNTITTDFGRFVAGPDPFQIVLTLAGSASSTWESTYDDYVVFSYDGNASVSYEYDYTPAAVVPEPTAIIIWSLLGALAITVGRRRRHKAT